MKVFRTKEAISQFVNKEKLRGKTVGLVSTMGCLHEGHLSLIRRSAKETGCTVLSIFVNPAQFGPNEDYKKYPRTFDRDKKLAKKAGANAIFHPTADQMYPPGFQTHIEVAELSRPLCGKTRPGHFKGVATVVVKLLNIVRPEVAYFGQKDAQQAIIIKRMIRDLDMGFKIKILPIVRERNGLAMSSRNKYLKGLEKRDALILSQSLDKAQDLIKKGNKDAGKVIARMRKMINSRKRVKIDYLAIINEDLRSVKKISSGNLIALAVKIGDTRLIDNAVIK